MTHLCHSQRGHPRERGIALVLGLIFLMLLTLIGTTSMSVTTQQERTSGNSRDYVAALEAAEVGLRDCETLLQGASVPPIDVEPGMHEFVEIESAEDQPKWQSANWSSSTDVRVVTRTNIKWPGAAPRCMIEAYPAGYGEGSGNTSLKGGAAIEESGRYRITARANGQFPATDVLLQSTYAR